MFTTYFDKYPCVNYGILYIDIWYSKYWFISHLEKGRIHLLLIYQWYSQSSILDISEMVFYLSGNGSGWNSW